MIDIGVVGSISLIIWFLGAVSMFLNLMNMGLLENSNIGSTLYKISTIIFWPVTYIISNLVGIFLPSVFEQYMTKTKTPPPENLEKRLEEMEKELENSEIFIIRTIAEDNKGFHYHIVAEDRYLEDFVEEKNESVQ